MLLPFSFYNSKWKFLSILLVVGLAVGGYFVPELGLGVIALILFALLTNMRSSRSFCAGFCPNGRSLSVVFKRTSKHKKLPSFLASREFRRMLCALMMFCVISLLARSNGSLAAIGKVFWAIYLASIGISTIAGLLWKPRAWCAFCPMGTLQDTIKGH
jgi:polyferredoxin